MVTYRCHGNTAALCPPTSRLSAAHKRHQSRYRQQSENKNTVYSDHCDNKQRLTCLDTTVFSGHFLITQTIYQISIQRT